MVALALTIPAAAIYFDDTTPYVDEHPALWVASFACALLALCSLALLWIRRREAASLPVRGSERVLVVLPFLSALLLVSVVVGGYRNAASSPAAAMGSFARIAKAAPLASQEYKASALFYLDRDDVVLVGDAHEARAFLEANPGGFLVLERDGGRPLPGPVEELPVVDSWQSPDGRRGYVLLGPGTGR
jgi:hypothetical protein